MGLSDSILAASSLCYAELDPSGQAGTSGIGVGSLALQYRKSPIAFACSQGMFVADRDWT